MQLQRVTRVDGVREGYVPGVGATQCSALSASTDAALVAPTPGLPRIQKISNADISRICVGFKPDQFSIIR